jgi:hypothetical protein
MPRNFKYHNFSTWTMWIKIAMTGNYKKWHSIHVIHRYEPQCIGLINTKLTAHVLTEYQPRCLGIMKPILVSHLLLICPMHVFHVQSGYEQGCHRPINRRLAATEIHGNETRCLGIINQRFACYVPAWTARLLFWNPRSGGLYPSSICIPNLKFLIPRLCGSNTRCTYDANIVFINTSLPVCIHEVHGLEGWGLKVRNVTVRI